MIDKCVHVIAKHFSYMYDLDFSSLHFSLFLKILRHEMLNIRDEYFLYKVVCAYVETNKEKLGSQEIAQLFDDVRLGNFVEISEKCRICFVAYSQFEEIMKNGNVPRQLIIDAGLVRLAGFESPKVSEDLRATNPRFCKRNKQGVTLDFDGKGKGVLR